MHVRDGVAADAARIATLADLSRDAADRLLRERTVRVAEDGDDVRGFVAYDVWNDAVHVTQLAGPEDVLDVLLNEPRELARTEGSPVEAYVPESDEATRRAVETAGFEARESGPRFGGEETRKYRWRPDEGESD